MATQTRSRPELRPVWTGRDQHPGYPRPSPSSATSPLYSAALSLPSPMYPASPGYDQAMRAHERALVDRLDHRGRREPQRSPGFAQYPRRQTLVAEARSILLSGIPDGLPRILPVPDSAIADRRQSLPPSFQSERRGSQQLVQELRDWGRVYFGNASVADCFVAAVALRRPSDSSSADETPAAKEEPPKGKNQVTIRARVRPSSLHQKPFLLRRTFDMDELRATIPEPLAVSTGERRLSAERASRSPVPPSCRRSSMASGTEQGPGLDFSRSSIRSTNTVPIHLKYARAFLPVLAALLYSGHIQPGDIVDLPLPYPEVWFQTVAYVYTGQGELTEAMKQNILYLGGKV